MDPQNDEWIGEITFMPESDKAVIASIGNAGGQLTETSRGKGYFGNALSALAPLARRHQLPAFMLVIPEDNASAIAAAERLQSTRIEPHEGRARFMVSV